MTGSHAVKVGFTLMHAWRYNTQEPNNSVALSVRGTQPFSLTQYATPIQFHETLKYNMGLFAQDQWRINRFTVNYGVRLDFLNARVDAQNIAAGPFTPARNFDAVENVPNWKDVDPRLGVSWDIFGDGKTAFKASVGRYVVGESYTIARQHVAQIISLHAFNLGDRLYRNHLSFIKDFAPEIGRGLRLAYTLRFF